MATLFLLKSFAPCIHNEMKMAATVMKLRSLSQRFNIQCKAVKIPTKWGHIAGKWWGSESKRPLLALHGWQDNAGSWDTLIPQLPPDCSVLAIDLPGHGLSSWFPPGIWYHHLQYQMTILFIKEYYKWDKVSLMAHSMGSIISMRFAAIHPDIVDIFIGFENLITEPVLSEDIDAIISRIPQNGKKLLIEEARLHTEPPSYSYEDACTILCEGTDNSISRETVKYLIQRGTKPSQKDPAKIFFARDSRLKYDYSLPVDKDVIRKYASKLQAPTLYIKAKDSKHANHNFAIEIRNIIKNNNQEFEFHLVPGTHHVHLNNPERVAPLVTSFLQRHGVVQGDTQNIVKSRI